MRPDDWHLTEDADEFLTRAGDFLRSRPALHTMPLTVAAHPRGNAGTDTPVFGSLRNGGEVGAAFYQRTPAAPICVTALTHGQADALAARLAALGHAVPGVSGDHDASTAFAEAWQRRTGATPGLSKRIRLYRLGALTPPRPLPAGHGRAVGEAEQDQLVRWCGEFAVSVGELPAADAASWRRSRFADRHFTFWEISGGVPVSMAAMTTPLAGMVRVDPVYTPAPLRGRGYAGAVTVAVSRAALAAGATDVVLFADPANITSNALYRRLGYVRLTEFTVYDFRPPRPSRP